MKVKFTIAADGRANCRIARIKMLRAATGFGLVEAKNLSEEIDTGNVTSMLMTDAQFGRLMCELMQAPRDSLRPSSLPVPTFSINNVERVSNDSRMRDVSGAA